MKKIFLIAFVFIQPTLMAQDSYYFKTTINPDRQLLIETSSSTLVEQDYKGDTMKINKIKMSGFQLPLQMKSEYSTSSILTTKSTHQENLIPFQLEFTRAHSHNEHYGQVIDKDSPLFNVITMGSFDKEGNMIINSITQNNRSLLTDSLSPQIKGFIVNVPFPNKSLRIGEKFTKESPMEIPISETGTAQLILFTTYAFEGLNDGFAKFEINQEIKLNPKFYQPQIKAHGSGYGRAIYDLKNNTLTNYETIWTLDINANSSNLTLLAKMHSKYIQTIKINK